MKRENSCGPSASNTGVCLWNSRSIIEIRNIDTHIIIWIDQWEMGPSFVLLHSVKLARRKDDYVFNNGDKRYTQKDGFVLVSCRHNNKGAHDGI
jgi:hypothetical protein